MAKNKDWLVPSAEDPAQLEVGDKAEIKIHLAKIEAYREKIPSWKKLKDRYLIDPTALFEMGDFPSESSDALT